MTSSLKIFVVLVLIIAATAGVLFLNGRTLWGPSGEPGLWSGDVDSQENSQRLVDAYSFTHISHGIGFYAVLHLVARSLPVSTRLIAAVALEGAWEVVENSDYVINKYREETISLNYYGDSILNSVSDIIMMIIGFWLAFKLSVKKTFLLFIVLEVALFLWIKDNLVINLIMLIYPLEWLKNWQIK